MLTIAAIRGTVTVALDGFDPHQVGAFEVPVTTNFNREGSVAITAVPHGAVLAAMADALLEAGRALLAKLPTADVQVLPDPDALPADLERARAAAVAGQHVVLQARLGTSRWRVEDDFERIVQHVAGDGTAHSIRRAPGMQAILFRGGGSLRIQHNDQDQRGRDVDLVIVVGEDRP